MNAATAPPKEAKPPARARGAADSDQTSATDKPEAITAPAGVGENVYETSPIKRRRRSRAELDRLCDELYALVEAEKPMTVRQVFYRAVSAGLIPKTEAAYKNSVCRLLAEMRRNGHLPYLWIADSTRWMRKPSTHLDLEGALEQMHDDYRRDLWADQPVYVEIWLEKDALAGVLMDVTRKFDVPLMVSRGFASLSFLHSAAQSIKWECKPAYLYYFGDHDPSGVVIDRKIEETLRELAPTAEIHFERVAVHPWQIERWNLPTRPTKTSDSRAKSFKGGSVEVDAIPPDKLRKICHSRIASHIDYEILRATHRVERAEKATLQRLIENGFPGGAG